MFKHLKFIVLWKWYHLKLITRLINTWAAKNVIKDSLIRIITVASLSVFFPFIKSNSAIWSYALVIAFETFLIIYRFKFGREFTITIVVISLFPLLLLALCWVLLYDFILEEFSSDQRNQEVLEDQVQQYDLENSQPRLFDISSIR